MNQNIALPIRLVVLISGNGSNLQAIIDDINNNNLPAQIVAVISNKADAYGLQRAKKAGIEQRVLSHRDFSDRTQYDQALKELIDEYQPDLVILAGFMRILSNEFVEHYLNKIMNIHPSLLPKYKGLNTHQRAIDAGDKEHGCSVHFVTPELDDGPVILQATVPIKADDTAETLATRVHEQEHRIYPEAIRLFAENKFSLNL
ncbi:MAG: phosphoribosylglycinamide formyltransferase [Gammaproteobacteria bacterium]|nr:phosphoribosylglycinamide formyltransferase [Gammaproteobacteria bacterium]MCW8988754.1 phosphoribosylglycinamide formyltransferase [Gammaproteobacteria bacterium]